MTDFGLRFIDSETDLSRAMEGAYDPWLVLLSVVLASVAGYAALLVTERIASTENSRARNIWIGGGAFAMGTGIWTMHFVGMLAFSMPMEMSYDARVTAISMLPGIVASGVALHVMSRSSASFLRLNVSGLLMAVGIGAMHYTGMSAMVMSADVVYAPGFFVFSIVVAHLLATLSLYVKFVFGRSAAISSRVPQLMSAACLGCAIAGMHYTAMAASYYLPGELDARSGPTIDPITLALLVSLGAATVLATAILSTIVDRRLSEVSAELRESEARTRLILETAGEGIIAFDEAGKIQTINTAAAEIFGWTAKDAIGIDVAQLVVVSADSVVDLSASAAREIQARRGDGEVFPASITVSQYVANGRTEYAAVIRDLTETRRLEAQLVSAQKLESIGQLAAGVAHEINTPAQYVGDNIEFLNDSFEELLGVLKPYGSLLAAAAAGSPLDAAISAVNDANEKADLEFLEEEIPRALTQSREGIRRVTKIVSAMKEFSHPGSAEKHPLDINRAIESTITVASNEWKYVAELDTEFDTGLELVPCLAAEFNQVVLNIVVNAAHAIGDLGLEQQGKKGRITIRTRREEPWACIEIADSGAGMPEEIRQRIFDPFFTTKEVGRGTGQGLAIARSVVVDKHAGTLEVASTPGEGTTFTIRLPLEQAPGADAAA